MSELAERVLKVVSDTGYIPISLKAMARRLDHLADLSLLIAYAEGHDQADSRAVAIAAREFRLDHVAA
ncbi:MAG: hypothetical protein JO161_04865 [Planctomycetaceae bacterium]|nr:hypothetical protein [Planctomycetaceae bacterium]